RRPVGGHGPLGPILERARYAEETIADVRQATGCYGLRSIVEGDIAQVGRHRNHGRRAQGAGPPCEIDTVVVKAEPGDGGGVPPHQIEVFPASVKHAGFEVAAVAHDVSGDRPNTTAIERLRELAERSERIGLARARGRRVERVAPLAEGRIASAVEDEIAA